MIPEKTRELLSVLRTDKRRATAGKEFWSRAAIRMGIYEEETTDTKTGRLRFRPKKKEVAVDGASSS